MEALKQKGVDDHRRRQGAVPRPRAAADRRVHERASGSQADHRHNSQRQGLTLERRREIRARRTDRPRSGTRRLPRSAAEGALALLLSVVDAVAALLLAADLCVVLLSVFYRYVLAAPIEWSDDVARGLMVALSFFGAAGALARNENIGVAFFVQKLRPRMRERVEALAALVVLVTAGSTAWYAIALGRFTTGQTTGSGLPLELTFYPMGVGAVCMTVFALARVLGRRRPRLGGSPRDRARAGRRGLGLELARRRRDVALGAAHARGVRRLRHRRRADRLRFGVHRADLHLAGGHAAWPDLRSADGARHRHVRAARDPLLHPGGISDGGERHVRPSHRAAGAPRRARARRAQRRHGFVHGDLLGHFRLEDGRRRGGGLGAHPGGSARAAESRRRSRIAGGLGGDGGDDSAVHQSDHSRLRRQPFDRRPVHGGIVAGRTDGARADRGGDPVRRRRPVPGGGRRGQGAARQALGRRGGHVGAAGDHLRRLPVGDRDRDRDFLIRRLLRAGGWRAGVPRVGTARRGAQLSSRRPPARDWCCSSSPRRSRSRSC